MIRITVEIVPKGMEQHKRTIAYAEICNDGTGTPTRGNYLMRLMAVGRRKVSGEKYRGRCFKQTEIWDYPRKQLHVWNLIKWGLSNIDKSRSIYGRPQHTTGASARRHS